MKKSEFKTKILLTALSIIFCLSTTSICLAAKPEVDTNESIASVQSGSDSGSTRFSNTYYTDYVYVSNGTLTLNTTGSSSSSGNFGAYLYRGDNFLTGEYCDNVAIHRNGNTTMTWRNYPNGYYYIKFVSNGVSQTLSYNLYS